jgi:hypothetical protein
MGSNQPSFIQTVYLARQEEKGSDEDSDSEAERRKVQQAKQQQVAAFTDVDNMDDEVERVLGHRWGLADRMARR